MKHIPNIITTLRFLGAACLLLCDPAGAAFWVIYGLCGVSDMVDGYLARRLHAESKTGVVMDSVADICLVVCCTIRLLPVIQIPTWYTKANKLAGLLLFIAVPVVFRSFVPIAVVAGVATFSAIQEGHLIRNSGKTRKFTSVNDL